MLLKPQVFNYNKLSYKMTLFLILSFSMLVGINAAPYVNAQSQAEPCSIVIFGASGDLTARKLLPAIYNLAHEGNLSKNTAVIGFARSEHSNETFRKQMEKATNQFSRVSPNADVDFWRQFESRLFYNQAAFEEDQGYENLHELLSEIDQELGTQGNRIYYLATHPSQFPIIIKKLHEHQLIYNPNSLNKKWSRVIIEKPFGNDLDSAIDLQKNISKHLDESQVYRMDHYLGKVGVQNLFTLRFENALFEPLWNNEYIDNVQITLSEDIGVGSRGHFWEETGSLRDVFQNHLMQLLAITAMEPPSHLNVSSIHEEKIKVLNEIRPFPLAEINNHVVRGQYGPGEIHGIRVPGYKQEKDVADISSSETFIAAKIFIDNPRWMGTPFYIRGGKRLPKQTTEIVITFKNGNSSTDQVANALFIRIQPNTGLFLKILSKTPTLYNDAKPVTFGYNIDAYFGRQSSEAYENLLYSCIIGDSSLYVRAEEQLAAWRLLTPVLDYWKSQTHEDIQNYEAGTWGPTAAERLLRENGHQWRLLED